jgi:hypothetical protein
VLKHVSPRKLALANRPAGVALSALRYLGKERLTPEVIAAIHHKIEPAEFEALKEAAPAWISDPIHDYMSKRFEENG